jgi:GDP-L-fucose synthase
MVGTALVRALKRKSSCEIIVRDRQELDLMSQAQVSEFFRNYRVDEVYLAAARVGGIQANDSYPADFIYDNLVIETNVIHGAHQAGCQKLLFLGSSCIYPRDARQPMSEEALLTGPLEPTNEPYAIAKIAGIKLCESYNRQHGRDYRSVMPTNLYGPGDNFHPEHSHVIPGLLRRFHEAKKQGALSVTVWGSGAPRREFLHVDDMASACLHVMGLSEETYAKSTHLQGSHINVGKGKDCTIRELAEIIRDVVNYEGELIFDTSKPDGAPRKLLNVDRLKNLGWEASTPLREGLRDTYEWFVKNSNFA